MSEGIALVPGLEGDTQGLGVEMGGVGEGGLLGKGLPIQAVFSGRVGVCADGKNVSEGERSSKPGCV